MTARKRAPATPAPEVAALRDHIAIETMRALLGADPRGLYHQIAEGHAEQSFRNVAGISYGMADAMIAARKR